MSSRDATRHRAQAHQNTTAFRHNKGSHRTKAILALPIDGLCARCRAIIEWRKQFRKYRPLTTPKRCVQCQEKSVTKAYHILCDACVRQLAVCAKCRLAREIVPPSRPTAQQVTESHAAEQSLLSSMPERARRTFLRTGRLPDALVGADAASNAVGVGHAAGGAATDAADTESDGGDGDDGSAESCGDDDDDGTGDGDHGDAAADAVRTSTTGRPDDVGPDAGADACDLAHGVATLSTQERTKRSAVLDRPATLSRVPAAREKRQ